MVDRLLGDDDFKVVTGDRDLGDDRHLPGVQRDQWVRVGKASVFYLAEGPLRILRVLVLRSTPCDLLYVNSFFTRGLSIWPVVLWRLGLVPARCSSLRVASSRRALWKSSRCEKRPSSPAHDFGLYCDGSIGTSPPLLRATTSRALGARSNGQRRAPRTALSGRAGCGSGSHQMDFAAACSAVEGGAAGSPPPKAPGLLRVVFVSHVLKNLQFALDCLRGLRGRVVFVTCTDRWRMRGTGENARR